MRELNLYQTEEDEREIIVAALADGCRILPDSNYETPEPRVINTIEEFQISRLTGRHFFIVHRSFDRLPVTLRQISKDGRFFYYISPSQGGPFVEFMGGGIVADEQTGLKKVRSGFLAHRPDYWNAESMKKEVAPLELSAMFSRLAKVVRATSVRIKPDTSVYWLGFHAKVQLESGVKLGLHEQWSLSSLGKV